MIGLRGGTSLLGSVPSPPPGGTGNATDQVCAIRVLTAPVVAALVPAVVTAVVPAIVTVVTAIIVAIAIAPIPLPPVASPAVSVPAVTVAAVTIESVSIPAAVAPVVVVAFAIKPVEPPDRVPELAWAPVIARRREGRSRGCVGGGRKAQTAGGNRC